MSSLFYGVGKNRVEHDYYATPPRAVEELLSLEKFAKSIWEPCCGGGHIANVLIANGHDVVATDLIDHGYGESGIDFLACTEKFDGDIMTNPPYLQAQAFVEHALSLLKPGAKLAMFLRLSFLETKGRKQFFHDSPPPARSTLRVLVSAARQMVSLWLAQTVNSTTHLPLPTPGLYGNAGLMVRPSSIGLAKG